MKSISFFRTQAIVMVLFVALTGLLVIGCAPFSGLTTTTVTNLSSNPPFQAFVGRFVVNKEQCSLWHYSSPNNFADNFIKLGNGEDVPSYETGLGKIADLPIGTMMKIHSIKRKKITTDLGGYDGTQAICTVFLADGRKVACQLNWALLNPDPRVWPIPKFQVLGK